MYWPAMVLGKNEKKYKTSVDDWEEKLTGLAVALAVSKAEALRLFTSTTGWLVMVRSNTMTMGNSDKRRDGNKIGMESKKVESESRKSFKKFLCLNTRIQMY